MPTTAQVILRQRLSEEIGDYESLTTSAAGAADGTTLIAASLRNLIGGADDDAFLNMYAMVTSGGASGEIRKTKSSAQAPNSITVDSAFSVQILSGVSFELHRYDPTLKHTAIRRAIEEVFPFLYVPIRDDWSIIVDDLLVDSSYEKAIVSGAFPDWTNVGAGIVVTAETAIQFQGKQAAKVVSGAGAAGQIYQQPSININQITGKSASFHRWVYATAPDVARVRLDWDGTNIDSSSYHSGADQWERLKIQKAAPSTATRVRAICEVASGTKTAYFDAGGDAGLFIDNIHKYTLPTILIKGPVAVSQQVNVDEPNGLYLPLKTPNRALRGRHLRLEGYGLLTRPSTETGTTEVGEPQVRLIVAQAEALFWKMMASPARSAQAERAEFLLSSKQAAAKAERLKLQPGMRMGPMGAMSHDGVWHVEEDVDGRYLVLDRR